MAELTALVRQ